jgi:uncharacterized protein (DUF1499 family)
MSVRTILYALPLLSSLISCSISTSAGELRDGHLQPCPNRPNCITSDNGDGSQIAPISFSGSSEKAWQRIQGIVKGLGGEIKEEQSSYLWATFTSAVFHFVDDVELRLVPGEKLIHIRSGSRIGYWDFGVNKNRVRKIRQLFQEASVNDKQPSPETSPGTG